MVLSRSIGSQWADVDLSGASLYAIYSTYSKAYLVLTNPAFTGEVFVNMDDLRTEFSGYTGTVNEWLVFLADRSLPTVPELPDANVKFAKYSNVARVGYKVDIAQIGFVYPVGYPDDQLMDLKISRPQYSTDMSLLHTHCLVSVNGFFHATDTDGTLAYVKDGAKTMRKVGDAHMGLLSFLDVGALTKVSINPDSIGPLEPDTPLKTRLVFQTSEDMTGKSFLLILGGYMVRPETDVFWQIGENTFCLDLTKLPYMERYLESKDQLDLSSLGLVPANNNPDVVSVEQLWSDDVIKKYLTLSQSFLVIVDVPYLVFNKIYTRSGKVPGAFTCYQDPSYPLIVGYGKCVEYWKTEEAGAWALSVADSYYRNFVISQQSTDYSTMVNDHLTPNPPYRHSEGYLLEIAGHPND